MSSIEIHIKYFAVLKEQRGLAEETVTTNALIASDLYKEVTQRFKFTLPIDICQVAINNTFTTWQTPLKSGDEVVFIPPVAGG